MVVGHQAAAQQRPKSGADRGRVQARVLRQFDDERRPARSQSLQHALGICVEGRSIGERRRRHPADVFAPPERQRAEAAVALTGPGPFATADAFVEPAGLIAGHATGEDDLLPEFGRQRQSLQAIECFGKAVRTAAARVGMEALPAQHEIGELRRRTSEDFAAQQRQAAALHLLQVVREGPLFLGVRGGVGIPDRG